ncbi:MAG: hypothetical protein VX589_01415 [Myxococcota bacterium]|nr:hypothetical protein [Myxococcota bacterium]
MSLSTACVAEELADEALVGRRDSAISAGVMAGTPDAAGDEAAAGRLGLSHQPGLLVLLRLELCRRARRIGIGQDHSGAAVESFGRAHPMDDNKKINGRCCDQPEPSQPMLPPCILG